MHISHSTSFTFEPEGRSGMKSGGTTMLRLFWHLACFVILRQSNVTSVTRLWFSNIWGAGAVTPLKVHSTETLMFQKVQK